MINDKTKKAIYLKYDETFDNPTPNPKTATNTTYLKKWQKT